MKTNPDRSKKGSPRSAKAIAAAGAERLRQCLKLIKPDVMFETMPYEPFVFERTIDRSVHPKQLTPDILARLARHA